MATKDCQEAVQQQPSPLVVAADGRAAVLVLEVVTISSAVVLHVGLVFGTQGLDGDALQDFVDVRVLVTQFAESDVVRFDLFVQTALEFGLPLMT